MSKQNVYLFGTNSIARMLCGFLRVDERYSLLGFTLDGEYCSVGTFNGYPLVPFEQLAEQGNEFGVINCVGYSDQLANRAAIDFRISNARLSLLSYISQDANVFGVEFGAGNIVMPRAVIEQGGKIGNGNLFYGGCYICHDAKIGDHNWFSAQSTLAGEITVGNRNFIGINCSVREYTQIGNRSTIGAGAVVISNVPNNVIVVGNPGKVKRYGKSINEMDSGNRR